MPTDSDQQLTGQVIALAGLLQSAFLVDQIAKTGTSPSESFYPSINSLFAFDVDTPEQIYGGQHGVDLGLRLLQDILIGGNNNQYRQVIRYSLGLMYLEKLLARKPELMSIIFNRLEHAAVKAEHFTENPQSVASSIAAIYQDTLSTLKFRIQISGSMQQLQNPANADNIRALLLAGVRAVVLWRQMGGRRWRLIFNRGKLLKRTRQLLADN